MLSQFTDRFSFDEELNEEKKKEDLNNSPFRILKLGKFILMFSKTQSFLEEKISLFQQYTKTVDPNMTQVKPEIEEFRLGAKYKKEIEDIVIAGYVHYAFINDVLPRVVSALYGKHYLHRSNSNCHGIVLVCGGLVPVLSSLDSPLIGATQYKSNEISIDNILPGDFIFFKGDTSKSYLGGNNHSFTFLDKDICISMNGRGEALEIYSTNDVIKLYNMPADIFDNKNTNVVVYRKNQDWMVPESCINALVEYYGFSCLSVMTTQDENYHRLLPIARKIFLHVLLARVDKNADDEKYFQFVCDRTLAGMHYYVSSNLYCQDSYANLGLKNEALQKKLVYKQFQEVQKVSLEKDSIFSIMTRKWVNKIEQDLVESLKEPMGRELVNKIELGLFKSIKDPIDNAYSQLMSERNERESRRGWW